MQSNLSKQNQDPFIVLKNQRKTFVRPKAKYVRKVPVPPRKSKKEMTVRNLEFKDFKNERKMTADSDIQNELISPSIVQDLPNTTSSKELTDLMAQETGNFSILLEEIEILERVLPLNFTFNKMEEENLLSEKENQLIDFFSDQ